MKHPTAPAFATTTGLLFFVYSSALFLKKELAFVLMQELFTKDDTP